ncbi:phosphatidate cytidylyltransferase [Chloroflexota bacterium]
MLKKRIISVMWILPVLIAAIWFEWPLPWFTVFIAFWGMMAVLEFYRLIAAFRVPPLTPFGIVWTVLFIASRDSQLLSALGPRFNADLLVPFLLTSAVVLPLIWLLLRIEKEKTFTSWAWTVAGILYVGWLLSYLTALRGMDDGRNWIFFTLFITFASDSSAFFVGRAFGKQKLAPDISPGKTREGAIGGVFGAAIVSLFFILPTPLSLPISWWHAMILGLLVSIFGQLGDLAESLFKRNVGVKDSSGVIPGHGGFLDRIDSVVFAGVVVYYYVVWVLQ